MLAFAEARKKGCSDTGDIDLVLRRSFDLGKTWSPLQVVWDDGESAYEGIYFRKIGLGFSR